MCVLGKQSLLCVCVCKYAQEAVQCVEELQQVPQLAVFVRVGVESTLERSHMAREHMGQLFHQLIHKGSLQRAQLYAG